MSSSSSELRFNYMEVSALFNNVDITEYRALKDKRVKNEENFPFQIFPNKTRFLRFTVKDVMGVDKKSNTFVHSINIYIGDYYLKDREYLVSSISCVAEPPTTSSSSSNSTGVHPQGVVFAPSCH